MLVNKWFSHYLFGADNDVTEMPDVLMQSADCKSWTAYDVWGNGVMRDYGFPSDTITFTKSDLNYDELDYAEQIVDLAANGVRHIHVYTMNKPRVAEGILKGISEILKVS